MYECLKGSFPNLYGYLNSKNPIFSIEETNQTLEQIEKSLGGIALPKSFRQFLKCTSGGLWLEMQHIRISAWLIRQIEQYPNYLFIGEFFWLADGDLLAFDISKGLIDGEYAVFYYDHEIRSNSKFHKVANSFDEFIEHVFSQNGWSSSLDDL
jgi:SMI1/KNR4 family protein SUKH-1